MSLDWLISHSIMNSRCFHAVSQGWILFVSLNHIPVYVDATCFSLHSPTDGLLVHILVGVNTRVKISLWDTDINSLDVSPEMEFLDHMVVLFIHFKLLLIFVWLGPSLLHTDFLVAASRGCCLVVCMVFSLQWLLLLPSTESRCLGFGSCGARA